MRLLLLLLFVALQQPSPNTQAGSQPKQPARSVQNKTNHNSNNPDNGPTINISIGSPQTEGNEGDVSKKEDSKAETDGWLTRYTGALVLVGAVQGVVLFLQFFWMRRNTKA